MIPSSYLLIIALRRLGWENPTLYYSFLGWRCCL